MVSPSYSLSSPLVWSFLRLLDLPAQDGAVFRTSIAATADDVVVTYVGRLVPIKRLEVAIEAIALARDAGADVRLALVGDGECRLRLESRAEELGVADVVSFTGYRKDVEAVIAGTDIAVLSSANEGTPVFLIQAAAGGRPAVATRVGGVPDVVDDDMGFLVGWGCDRHGKSDRDCGRRSGAQDAAGRGSSGACASQIHCRAAAHGHRSAVSNPVSRACAR